MLSNNKSSNIQEPPKFIFCYVLLANRLILSLYKIKTAQSYPSFRRTLRRVMKIILLFSLCRWRRSPSSPLAFENRGRGLWFNELQPKAGEKASQAVLQANRASAIKQCKTYAVNRHVGGRNETARMYNSFAKIRFSISRPPSKKWERFCLSVKTDEDADINSDLLYNAFARSVDRYWIQQALCCMGRCAFNVCIRFVYHFNI